MPLGDLDDVPGIPRFLTWFFREIIWELILDAIFWQYICGSIGWVTLRIVTAGRTPDVSLSQTVRDEDDEGMLASLVGLGVILLIAGVIFFLSR